MFLSSPSKRVPTFTSLLFCVITLDSFQIWPFSVEWQNSASLFFLLLANIINFFWYVFPCQIYIFIPLDPWKYFWKLKEDHFCNWVFVFLPYSGCFITCMGVHFPALSWITQSCLAPIPECQGSCGIVPNTPSDLVVSFSTCQGFKCKHLASMLTLTKWLLYSNASFFEPLSKDMTAFRGKMQQLFGCILKERYITLAALYPGPEALCLIFWQNV